MAAASHSLEEQFVDVSTRAAAQGFELVQYETPHGQLLWAWRRGDEPSPEFVTRRVALNYMDDWLRRHTATRHRSPIRRHARR